MQNDKSFLQYAVYLAKDGIKDGRGPFGSIVVKNRKIIAESNNSVVVSHDPTAHAEVLAIRKASAALGSHDLSDCVIYSSCEPCPMCLGAIYWAGIKKVVYASDRLDAEKAGFSDRLIYNEINLDPSKRNIDFVHIPDAGGDDVFRIWDEFDGKIPY